MIFFFLNLLSQAKSSREELFIDLFKNWQKSLVSPFKFIDFVNSTFSNKFTPITIIDS